MVLNLEKLIDEGFFSPTLISEPILVIPKSNFGGNLIHFTVSSGCSILNKEPEAVKMLYNKMFYDFQSAFEDDSFDVISLKEFSENNDRYCKVCSANIILNSKNHSNGFSVSFLVDKFRSVNILRTGFKENQIVPPGRSFETFHQVDNLKFVFQNEFALNSFKEELRGEITNFYFKDNVNFKKILQKIPKLTIEGLLTSPFKPNGKGKQNVGSFAESVKEAQDLLVKDLVSNTDFVIFSPKLLNVLYSQDFPEESNEIFSLLFFAPYPYTENFMVLPYSYFLFCQAAFASKKIRVKASVSSKVILSEIVSKDVLTMMESLFDESNETMSNYETLFEIASAL